MKKSKWFLLLSVCLIISYILFWLFFRVPVPDAISIAAWVALSTSVILDALGK